MPTRAEVVTALAGEFDRVLAAHQDADRFDRMFGRWVAEESPGESVQEKVQYVMTHLESWAEEIDQMIASGTIPDDWGKQDYTKPLLLELIPETSLTGPQKTALLNHLNS